MISRPLLLLSCSARKRSDTENLPALERYDGPAFRVVRRFERDFPANDVQTFVLSAKFGLLAADESVPLYDQRLDYSASEILKPQVRDVLRNHVCKVNYSTVFVDVSATYRPILGEFRALFPDSTNLQWAQGAPGIRATQLRTWLHRLAGVDNKEKLTSPVPYNVSSELYNVTFCGRNIIVSSSQVRSIADNWHHAPSAQKLISSLWHVAIDLPSGVTIVPLKWMVSRIVELPHNAFSTSQATSFLRKIGMQNAVFSKVPEFKD